MKYYLFYTCRLVERPRRTSTRAHTHTWTMNELWSIKSVSNLVRAVREHLQSETTTRDRCARAGINNKRENVVPRFTTHEIRYQKNTPVKRNGRYGVVHIIDEHVSSDIVFGRACTGAVRGQHGRRQVWLLRQTRPRRGYDIIILFETSRIPPQ